MKIAIIGAGIAGLTCARSLRERHTISVFEQDYRLGGHANTVAVHEGNREIPVDTGFIVFNETNYPNLCRLFDSLGIDAIDSDMSFSVRCDKSGVEYNGTSIDSLFAQRSNAFRPSHWSMIKDILRFHREAPGWLTTGLDEHISVADFTSQHRYGRTFVDRYLVPLGAALWSCSTTQFQHFPMQFVLEFLENHHMLQVDGRPQWKTVKGGSRTYVERLVAPFADRIRRGTPVTAVRRTANGVLVHHGNTAERFDEVIFACHADQALALLENPDDDERDILQFFPYQRNEAVLHTDTSVLPKRKKAWASWNYHVDDADEGRSGATVTYNMNLLQRLDTKHTYCVSLNPRMALEEARVLKRTVYMHPLFRPGRGEAQAAHHRLIRRRGVSYCGAYWGFGFHEDGIASALRVCADFNASPFELAA